MLQRVPNYLTPKGDRLNLFFDVIPMCRRIFSNLSLITFSSYSLNVRSSFCLWNLDSFFYDPCLAQLLIFIYYLFLDFLLHFDKYPLSRSLPYCIFFSWCYQLMSSKIKFHFSYNHNFSIFNFYVYSFPSP